MQAEWDLRQKTHKKNAKTNLSQVITKANKAEKAPEDRQQSNVKFAKTNCHNRPSGSDSRLASPGRWAFRSLGFQPVATFFQPVAHHEHLVITPQEIVDAAVKLTPQELDHLMDRLEELRQEQWDQQIARDVEAGRFDEIIGRAKQDMAARLARPL